ncbi:DEAD-domain-containing protein [Sporormia fimetaria CBS 119925]|uniref:RNA helicase n=1 Tax=Sporormia fimetaria CBS 119925 TaxID=1340428 RepID=A0A6A6VSQ3_9PLEO|nr:DEAD-domain-containing protein [Sporormia fimetaria CBS 119925]
MGEFGVTYSTADAVEATNGAATNGAATNGDAEELKKQELEKNLIMMREKGWNDPMPYNYEAGGIITEPSGDQSAEPAWLCNAVVYQFDDEYGEVGPPDKELEAVLFQGEHIARAGTRIQVLEGFDVVVTGEKVNPVRSFEDAGMHPTMLENVKLCGYHAPTPIQSYTIPAVLTGHDVVGIAQTGSGKTAAYLIPILSKLMGKARILAAPRPNPARYNRATDAVRAEPLVLVVCPTRELACQIFDEARRLCYRTMLRPCVIYGGAPRKNQCEQLEMGCDVLIATPGRLMDLMSDANLLSFNRLKFTIIDEADELLSEGWEQVMERLFSGPGNLDMNADDDHTYLMFSATFPKSARKLARDYMEEGLVKIKIGRVGSTHENIKQDIVYVEQSAKDQALYDLIMSGPPQRTLVFVNTKFTCDRVDDFLYNKGMPTTSIHSDRTQREREDALRAFKFGKTPVLVATGVTARGLDVANIKHVINYDLPSNMHGGITEYVHRIGRTARIGNEGLATSFYNDRNEDIAPDLVKLLIESKQEVPDFLESFKPAEGTTIEWHDGTDDESDDGAPAFGGFGDGGFGDAASNGDGGFGADSGAASGLQADAGFAADTDDKVANW